MSTIFIISVILAGLSLGSVIYDFVVQFKRINKLKRNSDITLQTKNGKQIRLGRKYDKKETKEFIDTVHASMNL